MSEAGPGIVVVHRVSPEEFFARSPPWDALVRQSRADPLFMGHAWQKSWWDAFGERHQLEPVFLEASIAERIVGKLALVRSRSRVRSLPVVTLQLLGQLAYGPATVRSEFLDMIVDPNAAEGTGRALLDFVASDANWDQLVLPDIVPGGSLDSALAAHDLGRLYVRRSACERSYEIPIQGAFDDYLASLSAGARRRMYGQRKRFAATVGIGLEEAGFSDDVSVAELDNLHRKRWESPLLGGGRREFFQSLAKMLPPGAVRISTFRRGTVAVSSLLNVRIGGRDVNIQGGFDPEVCKGVSPARLHWGMLIERAFRLREPRLFDLLLGRGRSDDFKADFGRPGREAVSVQLVRSRTLGLACRARDFATGIRRMSSP